MISPEDITALHRSSERPGADVKLTRRVNPDEMMASIDAAIQAQCDADNDDALLEESNFALSQSPKADQWKADVS